MKKIWMLGLALAVAAGPALAQGGGGRGFGFGGRGGGGSLGLLRMEEVQKELKLEAAQVELVNGVGEEMRGKMREIFQSGGQGGNREEAMQKMQALSADADKKLAQILNAQQMSRLKQLRYQQAGARALGEKEVQTGLKLTPDQVAQVTAATMAERQEQGALFQGFDFQNATPEQRQAQFQKMGDLRTKTDAKLNAILTDGQKKQWQSMLGAPFKFPEGGPRRRQNNNAA